MRLLWPFAILMNLYGLIALLLLQDLEMGALFITIGVCFIVVLQWRTRRAKARSFKDLD